MFLGAVNLLLAAELARPSHGGDQATGLRILKVIVFLVLIPVAMGTLGLLAFIWMIVWALTHSRDAL
ncbi:MAG TPA: hypothetical protein VH951_10130 [Dehalococcoidia bacterium]